MRHHPSALATASTARLGRPAIFKGRKLGMPRRPDEDFATYVRRVLDIRAPGLTYSVAACLKALGIQVDPAQLHDAANDTCLTHRISDALSRAPSDTSDNE